MSFRDIELLRQFARQLRLPASVVDEGLACGLLQESDPIDCHLRTLRRLRRLMTDLDLNAMAAIVLLRLRRDLEDLQAEVRALHRRRERFVVDDWMEAVWRDVED